MNDHQNSEDLTRAERRIAGHLGRHAASLDRKLGGELP